MILAITGDEFELSRYSTDISAVEEIYNASKAAIVISPSSSRMSKVLGGVAQRTKGSIDTHISGFSVKEGELTINRWYYRQRMEASLKRLIKPWFLTIDSGNFEAYEGTPGSQEIKELTHLHHKTDL